MSSLILLFGEIAKKTNNPMRPAGTETAGIVANRGVSNSLFNTSNHDTCEFTTPAVIDYSHYASNGSCEVAFMSNFADGLSALSDGGFTSMGGDCGFSSGDSGGFSSMC